MPKNNSLSPIKKIFKTRFGEQPTTKYLNNLEAMKLTVVQAPTVEELRQYIPEFSLATWIPPSDCKEMTTAQRDECIWNAFHGYCLPTALETIRMTFCLEGIDLSTVTHILRYRTASFSAECSGDKWFTHNSVAVPGSIQNSDEFYERFKKINDEAKQLYVDMLNTKKISIQDARAILPRCVTTYYYMSMSIKDIIAFVRARIDRQIQPETDNYLAYLMWESVLERYPHAAGLINLHFHSPHYTKMARTAFVTNMYEPEPDYDNVEWNEEDNIFHSRRNEMNGTNPGSINVFDQYFHQMEERINKLEKQGKKFIENMRSQLAQK